MDLNNWILRLERWVLVNQEFSWIMLLVVVLFGSFVYLTMKPIRGGRRMTQLERKDHINKVICDGITEMLEEAEFQGRLTRVEVNKLYRKFASKMGYQDLIPTRKPDQITPPTDQKKLKKLIQARLENGEYTRVEIPTGEPKSKLASALFGKSQAKQQS